MAKKLEITTVIGCRNQCSYCPQDKLLPAYAKLSSVRVMSFDLFKACIDKCPPDLIVDFSGMSEPFQNPKCLDMIKYVADTGRRQSVFTTTVGLSLKDVDQLKAIPFIYFCLHVADAYGRTGIQVNERYLDIVESCTQAIPSKSFVCLGPPHPKILDRLQTPIENSEHTVSSRANNSSTMPSRDKKTGTVSCMSCGSQLNHNVLLPNGDVALCCMDYGLQHVIGSLYRNDYDSLFSSRSYQDIEDGLSNPFSEILCRYCENSC